MTTNQFVHSLFLFGRHIAVGDGAVLLRNFAITRSALDSGVGSNVGIGDEVVNDFAP